MKKYLVRLSNKQRELFTQSLLEGHIAHLKALTEEGVLQTCGPCDDGSAIMIFCAENTEQVRTYVEADPFAKADYYKQREIVEFFEATVKNNFGMNT